MNTDIFLRMEYNISNLIRKLHYFLSLITHKRKIFVHWISIAAWDHCYFMSVHNELAENKNAQFALQYNCTVILFFVFMCFQDKQNTFACLVCIFSA